MGLTKNHGFTLMEILTVIVIIVILAGLLTPAISKAQRQAKKVECMNNLRQIGMALQQYALDNNGNFPTDLNTLTTTPAGDPYLPAGTNILNCTADSSDKPGYIYNPANIQSISIATATASTPIAQCPSTSHPVNQRNILYGDGHVGAG